MRLFLKDQSKTPWRKQQQESKKLYCKVFWNEGTLCYKTSKPGKIRHLHEAQAYDSFWKRMKKYAPV